MEDDRKSRAVALCSEVGIWLSPLVAQWGPLHCYDLEHQRLQEVELDGCMTLAGVWVGAWASQPAAVETHLWPEWEEEAPALLYVA